MKRNLNDLLYFVTVARERSFTRAAAHLGVSQPALSHAISELEKRTNIPLLTRTTRKVTPTKSGLHLMQALGTHFDGIESEINKISHLHHSISRTLRLACESTFMSSTILEKLGQFIYQHPHLCIEIDSTHTYDNDSTESFDAGIALKHTIGQDMITVPVGKEIRMAVVGSSEYFKKHPLPEIPEDLLRHQCIHKCSPGMDIPEPWGFQFNDQKTNIDTYAQLYFNASALVITAVLAGLGIAYLVEDEVMPFINSGQMVRVLNDWCHLIPGYHLYYSTQRVPTPVLSSLIEILREK
ncbi:LysR family transcriptional regulator [Klebsiella aerogenes]|uniref:LysR family transcriptional regulator n=1 Tax=Klebsiella aerogenes TaxID=548 RepID=UPI001866D565|nr:LysR family transcriptional regulator [Klebsiella aerogenes]